MASEILMKLIRREPVTDDDLADQLFDVCDRVHASCNNDCPVYEKFGGTPKNTEHGKEYGCDAFKRGYYMLGVLRGE